MKLIFTITLILIFTNSQSQNCHKVKEIVTNRHEPNGHTKSYPYTLFDRHNGVTFQQTINKIRVRIYSEKPTNGDIYLAYKIIHEIANRTRPIDEGMMSLNAEDKPNAPSSLAVCAKYNAFIFLVGLDENGNFMDTTSYNGVVSHTKRDGFRKKAYSLTSYQQIQMSNPLFPHINSQPL